MHPRAIWHCQLTKDGRGADADADADAVAEVEVETRPIT